MALRLLSSFDHQEHPPRFGRVLILDVESGLRMPLIPGRVGATNHQFSADQVSKLTRPRLEREMFAGSDEPAKSPNQKSRHGMAMVASFVF